jgi:hypothetical protein
MSQRKSFPALHDVPVGYMRTWRFDINQRREATYLSVWGVALMFAAWIGFLALARALKPAAFPKGFLFQSSSVMDSLLFIGELLIVFALMVVLHEGLHGLCFWAFTGERPKFAFKVYYASAAAPGWFFPRGLYLVTALAPLVGITLICLAMLAWMPVAFAVPAFLLLVFNTSGAVGDIWVALRLFFLPSSTYIKDDGDRIEFYDHATGTPTIRLNK